MALSRPGEKRNGKRFVISCPIAVKVLTRGKGRELEPGRLHDIGVGGARLDVGQPLAVGTRVILHVHFSGSDDRVTTMRFEGTVMRAQEKPLYEIAVQFRRSGRFLRNELGDLFASHQTL
jgi:hypothetical protein